MLMRFDPFAELDRLAGTRFGWPFGGTARFMPLDAYKDGDHYVVELDLPGVSSGDIEVTVDKDVLSVTAKRSIEHGADAEVVISERPQGSFTRRLSLGDGLDKEHVEAEYRDGVLILRLPVLEAAKPRKIEIGAAGEARELTTAAA
jgi:HSP20 family protein